MFKNKVHVEFCLSFAGYTQLEAEWRDRSVPDKIGAGVRISKHPHQRPQVDSKYFESTFDYCGCVAEFKYYDN